MSFQFKVGDVCIGQNFVVDLEYNGMECVITEPLLLRYWWHEDGTDGVELTYGICWSNGNEELASPKNLRKRRPPATDEATARQAMLDCIERAKMPIGVTA